MSMCMHICIIRDQLLASFLMSKAPVFLRQPLAGTQGLQIKDPGLAGLRIKRFTWLILPSPKEVRTGTQEAMEGCLLPCSPWLVQPAFFFFSCYQGFFFIMYFPQLHFQCYPKSPPYPHPNSPTHPFPFFGPGVPLYWGIYSLCVQWASLSSDGQLANTEVNTTSFKKLGQRHLYFHFRCSWTHVAEIPFISIPENLSALSPFFRKTQRQELHGHQDGFTQLPQLPLYLVQGLFLYSSGNWPHLIPHHLIQSESHTLQAWAQVGHR
jgi:hypothetical protein